MGHVHIGYSLIWLVWTAIPIILYILPADYFDQGQTVCLSVWLLDVECWGCGLTRGVMHLIHFDFSVAYAYNKLSFVLFPLLVYVWGKFFFAFAKNAVHKTE